MKVNGTVAVSNLSPRILKSMSATKAQAVKAITIKPLPRI